MIVCLNEMFPSAKQQIGKQVSKRRQMDVISYLYILLMAPTQDAVVEWSFTVSHDIVCLYAILHNPGIHSTMNSLVNILLSWALCAKGFHVTSWKSKKDRSVYDHFHHFT
jgi:hypothetical protein